MASAPRGSTLRCLDFAQERMLVLPPNHATLEAEILFINGFEAAL